MHARSFACRGKQGMGKTAVFVLSTLQQIEPVDGEVHVLVMCHTRELALQIKDEYVRFTKYMPNVKTEGFFGGIPISNDIKTIKENCPVSMNPCNIAQQMFRYR